MKIAIAERLHPFSHSPGAAFLLPFSCCKVTVYPTRLICTLLDEDKSFHVDFSLRGPLEDFTAELDLERGQLRVWGESLEGFVRYRLFAKPDGIWIQVEKAPGDALLCCHSLSASSFSLSAQEYLLIPLAGGKCTRPRSLEQLSLGMHKSQEWDHVRSRRDLKEIFPHWLRLGQVAPSCGSASPCSLLEKCRELIARKDKPKIGKAFEQLFLAAFEGVCVPRSFDSDYQGIVPDEKPQEKVLPLLTQSAALIRSLFFQENAEEIHLLPCLLPEFHCGRMVGISSEHHPLRLDIEWTKKYLRTVVIYSQAIQTAPLHLPFGISSCRLRRQISGSSRLVEHGKRLQLGSSHKIPLEMHLHETLYLDRFE